MADESAEHREPSSSQTGHHDGSDRVDRASDRRRIIITSLLAPPAVMTLRARSARGAPTTNSCKASVTAASTHCH